MKNFLRYAMLALVAMLGACEPITMVAYNGCAGTWVRVRDGKGRVLADSIPYGVEKVLDLETYVGAEVKLIAIGFKSKDGSPAGEDHQSRSIYRSTGMTTPQIDPWSILGLWTSDGYGCRTR